MSQFPTKPIRVCVFTEDLTTREVEFVRSAIQAANGLQNQFLIAEEPKRIQLPGERALRTDESFARLQRLGKTERAFCISSRRFANNDFQSATEESSLVTIADWEVEFAPPGLKTYLLYQFAFAFVTWAANHVSDNALYHEETIGCRMDFCGNKTDLRVGMLTGHLCTDCRGELVRLGATQEHILAIRRILDYVRSAAAGEEPPIEWNTAFVVMRFTENDENQKAYKLGIRPGLEDVGIQVLRGDDFVQSRPLLEKVTDMICRARFIVAKVDEERMNVYYELGLAMGSHKDVLLVSERHLKLPSDLSNWECLTYPAGDYRALRAGIATFYVNNYYRKLTAGAQSTAEPNG